MECLPPRSILLAILGILSVYACPFPWRGREGSGKRGCYLFHSGAKDFRAAEEYCRSTSGSCAVRNASLASIEDEDEFFFIRDLVYQLMGKPTAFYLGGYTTPVCSGGAWTDRSSYKICTGGEGQGGSPCAACDVTDASCQVDKCMVASLQNWLSSAKHQNFTAAVGGYNCTQTELPFVCKAPPLVITLGEA